MDHEFINLFIEKQAQFIAELVNKNLMVETRYQILEKRYNELTQQHHVLLDTLERAKAVADQAGQEAAVKKEAKRTEKAGTKHQPSDVVEKRDIESQF